MRPNLNFAGHAADVLAHYQAALGGELEIMRFAGSPAAESMPPEWADKVLYGRLHTPFGEIDVMDAPRGRESQVGGGNVSIAIDVDDEHHAASVFAMLAEGGDIGMTSDKFGVRWMVSVAPVALTAS